MADRTDGGAAFPTAYQHTAEGVVRVDHGGMSLRDWFAGQALSILLAFPEPDPTGPSDLIIEYPGIEAIATHYAKLSYIYADAMLAARPTPDQQSGGGNG